MSPQPLNGKDKGDEGTVPVSGRANRVQRRVIGIAASFHGQKPGPYMVEQAFQSALAEVREKAPALLEELDPALLAKIA